MSVVQLHIRVGLLVQERLSPAGRGAANQFPKVSVELVAAGGGLAVRDDLERAVQRHRGLGRQRERLVRLAQLVGEDALEEPGAVAERDEYQGFALTAQTMYPAVNLLRQRNRGCNCLFFGIGSRIHTSCSDPQL